MKKEEYRVTGLNIFSRIRKGNDMKCNGKSLLGGIDLWQYLAEKENEKCYYNHLNNEAE